MGVICLFVQTECVGENLGEPKTPITICFNQKNKNKT